MAPNRYTELFFLDEATALAAGHRPCHECRRADSLRFREAWTRAAGLDPLTSLDEVDRVLHEDRLEEPGRMRRWTGAVADLPGGAMVAVDGTAHLARGGALHPWSPAGYGPAHAAPPAGSRSSPRARASRRSAPATSR